jgi:catechol 2,3-dioxygenase-like lactoylglutathione lyase family enzyme
MAQEANSKFEFRGLNHLALVCRDMRETVHFYRDILGMPLIKTIDLPGGMGQHFFFDLGNGASLAFFWFPGAPENVPGVVQPHKGGGPSAHGSMNHVAIDIPVDRIEEYRERLLEAGVDVSEIKNHDDSERQVSPEVNETTFVRSIYFNDPDGIRLELAGWARELTSADVGHEPVDAEGRR